MKNLIKLVLLGFFATISFTYLFSQTTEDLFQAIRDSNINEVKRLVNLKDSNICINCFEHPEYWGFTPLTVAISMGNYEIVKFLIDNGAEVNFQKNSEDNSFCAPLDIALNSRNYEIIELLIKNGATELYDAHYCTYYSPDPYGSYIGKVCSSIEDSNDLKILELLLINGFSPNIPDRYDNTPIYQRYFDIEALKLLIKYGANVNYLANGYDNPLISYCVYSNDFIEEFHSHDFGLKKIKLLLDNGANINFIRKSGGTDLNINKGYSALYYAAEGGNNILVEFLIKNGAKINLERACSPIQIAKKNRHFSTVNLLLKYGAKESDLIFCDGWQWFYCNENGYIDEQCYEKLNFNISNETNSNISSITFNLIVKSIYGPTGYLKSEVVYKKKHTISIDLAPGEKTYCKEFFLANKLPFTNDVALHPEIEIISFR